MKEYKILCNHANYLEEEVNKLAQEGYEIEKVVQQEVDGTHICIIMSRTVIAEEK